MEAYLEKPITNEEFPMRVITNHAFGAFPKHWHSEIEILHMIEGEMIVDLADGVCNLKKGDILIIGANKIHGYIEGDPLRKIDIILFNHAMLEELIKDIESFQWVFPMLLGVTHMTSNEGSNHLLEQQINSLILEYTQQEPGYKYAMVARLYDFVTLLLRALPKKTYTKEMLELLQKKSNMLLKINLFIKEHYQDDISLDQISKIAGYSTFHFIRVFKSFTGITFMKYLTYFRLEKARKLLLETDESIVDIAFQSGFGSIKTFNRVFKEYSGCTPSDFKKAIFEK